MNLLNRGLCRRQDCRDAGREARQFAGVENLAGSYELMANIGLAGLLCRTTTVPAGEAISFAPGRSGHHACRHYDRHARCVAGCGLSRRRVTPAPWTVCPRSGSDRTKGLHSPWAEPWWNAGRRAAQSGRAAQAAPSVARPARRVCVREVLPAFAGVPLPLFLFSYFVIAGLDPAIHAAKKAVRRRSASSPHFSIVHRVKPGGDEENDIAVHKTRARIALRERNVVYFVILRWRRQAALEGCTDQMPAASLRGPQSYRAGHFGPDPLAAASG